MNISTYEARIAALEAQLGPDPGPSGGVAIESITLSPDINGINAILAATQFNYEDGEPLDDGPAWSRGFNITRNTTETLPSTIEVTVTPRDDLYVMYQDQKNGTIAYGEKGEPVTFTAYKSLDDFRTSISAINTNDISTADYGVFVDIQLLRTA